jgi:hypothetical protein
MGRKSGILLFFMAICSIYHAQNDKIYNADSARSDLKRGKLRWLVYGSKFYVSPCRSAIAHKYGFTYFQASGCEVTERFLKGVEEYNSEMQKLLVPKNGEGWQTKCEKEMKACK